MLAYGFAQPLGMDATGVFLGDALTNVLIVILAGLCFLRGSWTDGVVKDESRPESEMDTGSDPTPVSGELEDDG